MARWWRLLRFLSLPAGFFSQAVQPQCQLDLQRPVILLPRTQYGVDGVKPVMNGVDVELQLAGGSSGILLLAHEYLQGLDQLCFPGTVRFDEFANRCPDKGCHIHRRPVAEQWRIYSVLMVEKCPVVAPQVLRDVQRLYRQPILTG